MSESIVAVEFGGRKVRTDSEGRVSVLDALAAVGVKNVSRAWKRTQTDNPELLSLATFIQAGPGRPTAFMAEDGIKQLLMTVQTRYLTASGKKLVTTFRAWLADLDTRFHAGDVTLAAEIIDRQTDPAKLEWVARRAENKGAALSLNAGIQRHGGSQRVYSKVHDTLNVAVTGMTAREIQRRGSRTTKDNLSVPELTLSTMSQIATVSGLEQRGAMGDGQILSVAGEVGQDIAAFRRKWLGARPYPVDGFVQVDA